MDNMEGQSGFITPAGNFIVVPRYGHDDYLRTNRDIHENTLLKVAVGRFGSYILPCHPYFFHATGRMLDTAFEWAYQNKTLTQYAEFLIGCEDDL